MQTTKPVPGRGNSAGGCGKFSGIGRLPGSRGTTGAACLLYRGGNLDALQSPADHAVLESWHLAEILDLRSEGEWQKHPDPMVPGAQYRRVCAMRMADGSEMDFSSTGIERLAAEKAAFEKAAGHPVHDYDWFSVLYRQMPFGNPPITPSLPCWSSTERRSCSTAPAARIVPVLPPC